MFLIASTRNNQIEEHEKMLKIDFVEGNTCVKCNHACTLEGEGFSTSSGVEGENFSTRSGI